VTAVVFFLRQLFYIRLWCLWFYCLRSCCFTFFFHIAFAFFTILNIENLAYLAAATRKLKGVCLLCPLHIRLFFWVLRTRRSHW
jgi:hypothetical protein